MSTVPGAPPQAGRAALPPDGHPHEGSDPFRRHAARVAQVDLVARPDGPELAGVRLGHQAPVGSAEAVVRADVQHLQGAYPYLFSLAIRTNPLDPNASAVVG